MLVIESSRNLSAATRTAALTTGGVHPSVRVRGADEGVRPDAKLYCATTITRALLAITGV